MHNEARKLLIQALEKTHNAREVAENFSVNRGTVYRLKRQLEETGSIETRTYLRGRKSALSREDIHNIEQLLKEKPDITIAEIIDTLVLDGFAFVDIHANLLDCYKCRQIERFQQRHVAGEYAALTVQPPVR